MRCENCRFYRKGSCGNPDSDFVTREVQPEDGCLHGIINQKEKGDGCDMPGMRKEVSGR